MPVIIPTPDDLERMSWWQRDRARRTVQRGWPRAEYAERRRAPEAIERPMRQPWQDPDHPDWVEATLARARELLEHMGPDPESTHRSQLWTGGGRRSSMSGLRPQAPSQESESSCGQVGIVGFTADSTSTQDAIVAS